MTKYISHAETNKLIRQTLKAEFPNVKFSVKKTGGSATRITYTGNVTKQAVSDVISIFKGASFDPMYDLETPRRVHTEGETISYGSKYIFVDRILEDIEVEQFAQYFADGYQWYDFNGNALETRPEYTVQEGEIKCDRIHFVSKQDLAELVWREAHKWNCYDDFAIAKRMEHEEREVRYQQYEAKQAQEQKWDSVLEIVQTEIEEKAQPEISEYEQMLIAAGWIDAA